MGATCGSGAADIELNEKRQMLRMKRKKIEPSYNQTYAARDEVDAIWTKIDANGNGVLEKDEFREFYDENVLKFWASFGDECDVFNFDDFFDFIDENGNGTIEKEELISFLARQKQLEAVSNELDSAVRGAREMVNAVFTQFDTNKNGYLDKAEMQQWFESSKEENAPILSAFRAHEASIDSFDLTYSYIDKDNDGNVDRDEMLAYFIAFKKLEAYPEIGARIKEAEMAVEEMWPELDEDGDGFVDKEEFRRWYDPRVEELAELSMQEGATIDLSNYDAIYSFTDSNGSGLIEKFEMADLLIYVQTQKDRKVDTQRAFDKVTEIFGYYDADKDKLIDKTEFANVLYYYYYDLQRIKDINVDNLDEAFGYIDTDSDGKIDFEEMCTLYVQIYEAERRAALK